MNKYSFFIAACFLVLSLSAGTVFALSLSYSSSIKVNSGSYIVTDTASVPLTDTATAANGAEVVIKYTITNSSGSDTANLIFSPTNLLNGEINQYYTALNPYTADTTKTLNVNGSSWKNSSIFQIHTNTQSQQNYSHGVLANGATLSLYVPIYIPLNYNQPSITFSLNPSCTNTCTVSGTNTVILNVAVQPTLSSASFASAISNDASNSTTLTVTAADPSGISDISTVKVDLTSIGGSNSYQLYDDGAHGDGAAANGVYGATGISTSTASAGTYSTTLTATDTGGNIGTTTASIIVQSSGAPIVSKNSQSLSVVSANSGYQSSTINWQSSQACGTGVSQGYRIVLGGTAGNPDTGTVITDWQASGCSANTARNDSINQASLALGANTLYLYVKTSDNLLGYFSFSLTRDNTVSTITKTTHIASLTSSTNGYVQWYANEAGNYTLRNGGTSGDPSSGTQIIASTSYPTASTTFTSNYLNAQINEGANTLYLHFTDLGGNITSLSFTVTKDSTDPVTAPSSILLVDNDNSNSGIDGRDFTVTWTEPTDTSHITGYRIYIYKSTDSYSVGDVVKNTASVGTTSWTGTAGITTDSKGNILSAGLYKVAMMSLGSGAYEDSGTVFTLSNTSIAAEDLNPPSLVSAQFVSNTLLRLTFDKNLSTNLSDHFASKISSSIFTINTSLGTNGVESVNGANIFFYVNALNNSALTASDLTFLASYQEDSLAPTTHNKPIITGAVTTTTGVLGPVGSRGTFDANTAIVNPANTVVANVTGQSITDGQAPNPLTIVAPTASTKSNSTTLNFQYTLPETMNSSTLKLKFTRTGGATDANSPHTITLTNAASGSHTQSITLTSFTSSERGAGDSLANGGIYTLDLSGSDVAGNQATTVSSTGFMFDTVAPSIPVVQRFPSGAPSNNYWTTTNAPLLQWSASSDTNGIDHYLVQIASNNTFSVVQAYTSTTSTSWQVPSALGDGAYYWRVLAYDPAGNASAGQSTVEGFIVDTTGPSITVNSSPSVRTTTALTIALNAANDGSGVANNVNGYQYSLFKADADCSSNASTSAFSTATSYAFTSMATNTNYCFKVQAKDGLGNTGAFSSTVLLGTLANQVTGFSGLSSYSSGHSITLSWTNQGQSGVKIEQDLGCDGTYETTPLDNASYAPANYTMSSGLSANTCYQFRVDSYNVNGVLNGTSRPTTQITTLPAAPTNLTNNTNTTSTISYDWDDISGATTYKVYQTDSSGNNAVLVSSPTTSTYTKTGLTANSQYCIKVSTLSAVGEGPAASFICAYASADTPVSLSAASKTTTSVVWSWLSGGVEAFFYAFTNTPAANSGWILGTSWNQTSLSANTSYQCFVKAKNSDGDETSTINTSTYTAIETPTLSIGTVASTSIQSSTTVSNIAVASSGVFFENTTSSVNSGWITTTSWNNTGLSPNTQYTYRIKARNGAAEETNFSSTVNQYTNSAVPSLTVGESVTDTQLSVRLQANSNPSGTRYQIYRSFTGSGDPTTNAGAWTQVQDWTAHSNNDSFFDTGLSAGTTYYYIARTENDATTPVVSNWSSVSSIATDASSVKISESSGKLTNSWYNGASLDLVFHINSVTGVAYYRYKFDSSSSTDLNSDATCIDTADAQLGIWGNSGSPADMTTDLNKSFTSTGTYYAHFVACSSGIDGTPGTADDVRVNNATNPQINFGSYKFDNDNPTISNNYTFSGVLKAATQNITLSPSNGSGSGIAEVRYCIDDSTNDCAPFPSSTVLASPYQFSYSTTIDQYVRYQTKDSAGNLSSVGFYHIMIDADAPIISTVVPTQTSGVLKTPTDSIYQAGDTVRIKLTEQNVETGLTGSIQITSASTSYNSGSQAMSYDNTNHLYYYDWDTTGRTQATDYILTLSLTDSVGNSDSDNGSIVHIDNTSPNVTAFAISDVTSASTTYTNSRTLNIDSLTAADTDSSVSYYRVGDVAGDVSAPVVIPSDFTLTSLVSNNYTLTAAEGAVSVFAWVMDAANNISSAAKQLITLDLTNPVISAFSVADQSSGSTGYTNNTLVNVASFTATDANGIKKYLINQSSSTPSVATMNAASNSAPTTYTLTGGEGARVVYAWVMDNAENISGLTHTINYDITPPTITSVRYLDNNSNGQIDRVKIRFSESIANSGTSVANGAGMTIVGHTITAASGSLSTTTYANDTLTLTVDETGVDTSNMPDFSYTAASGNVQDLAENVLGNVVSGDIIESDGVAPYKTGMTLDDTNANGIVDRITVSYSENLQGFTGDQSNWTISNIPSGGTLSNISATNGSSSVIIAITEGSATADTSVGTLTVALNSASSLQDASGNIVNTFTALAPSDNAKPVFMSKQTQDLDSNGKIDALKITMSEGISDISLTASNFSLAAGNSRSIATTYTNSFGGLNFTNGIATGTTADDSVFYIKLTEGTLVDTGDTPALSYSAGTLQDLASSPVLAVTTASMTVTDKAQPRLTGVTLKDTNSDGNIETAELIFSENMNDSSLNSAGFSIGGSSGTGMSTTVQGDSDVNDDRVLVTLTNGVSGTNLSNADVSYSATTGTFADLNTNLLADRISSDTPNEIDKAAPVISSLVYSDNGTAADATDDTITVIFSESIDDATLDFTAGGAISDFTVAAGGSIANATTSTGNTNNDDVVVIDLNSGDTALTPGTSTLALKTSAVADLASPTNTSTSTAAVTTNGAVIVNEVIWGGTSASTTTDEYIELRNLSSTAIDFSTAPHVLYINGVLWKLLNTEILPGNGYFLISRYDFTDGASSLLSLNATTSTNHIKDASLAAIPDSGLQIKLYKGTSSSGVLLDTVDDGSGVPLAGSNSGTYKSMERNDSPANGTIASSWHSSDGSTNFQNTSLFGTPKAVNVIDGQAPSFSLSPETRIPAPNTLRPDSSPRMAVDYADNVGGSGIDTAQVKFYLDLDQNTATSATVGSTTLSGCETDKTSQAVISSTRAYLIPSSPLPSGRYRTCVLIKDIRGNEATTSWDFWIDNFSMNVTEVTPAKVIVGAGNQAEIIGVTKLRVTSYGAGINLTGAFPLLDSGANQIVKTNAEYDTYIEKKIGSGSFNLVRGYDGYLDWNNSSLESIAKDTTLDVNTNAQLKTYDIYLRYRFTVNAVQPAGIYTGNVSFNTALTY